MTVTSGQIAERAWQGPSAYTGKTMADYAAELENVADLPAWVTRAAVAIARAYGIKGSCDPAYIANVIHHQFTGAYECMNCGELRTREGWVSCEDRLGASCRPVAS